MIAITFTLIMVMSAGTNVAMSVVVPNFKSLAACQAYGRHLYAKLPGTNTIYECLEMK